MRLKPEADRTNHRPDAPQARARRHRQVVVVIMLGALVASGCGSSGSHGAQQPATTTRPASTIARTTSTVDQLAADKAEITDTFNGWGTLVQDLEAESTKWDAAKASQFIGGPVLENARGWVPKWQKARKRAIRPKDSKAHFAVQQISVAGDHAVLRTCEVNDLVTESSDGSVLDDSVKTHFAIWEARRGPNGWRLWSVKKSWSEDGVAKCGS